MDISRKLRNSLRGLFLVPLCLMAFGGKEDLSVFTETHVVRSTHFVLHYEDALAPARGSEHAGRDSRENSPGFGHVLSLGLQ